MLFLGGRVHWWAPGEGRKGHYQPFIGAPTSGGGGGVEQVVDPRGPILGLQKRRALRVIFGPQLTELVYQLGFRTQPSW